MLRYKGVLLMKDADRKVVFQGVHQIMGSDLGAKWGENDVRGSKMVFIGKNLPKTSLLAVWNNVWYKLSGFCGHS
jgi:G3E family GTPase